MYYPEIIEENCWNQSHIDMVLAEIEKNVPKYLDSFIETEGGNAVKDSKLEELAAKFGSSEKSKKKNVNKSEVILRLIDEAVEDFNSDREAYQNHLDIDALEEYGEDVGSFKNTILKNQIPIIRRTLQNMSAKELDKYRFAFKMAQPGDLFKVVNNIIQLGEKWKNEWYDSDEFESIESFDEMDYSEIDEEEYTAFGVIGGGIKSHMLYKLYPEMYANRSRDSVWALWYLTDKNHFDCKQDSEFLMINIDEGSTQQNYFYPIGLFSYYALKIYQMLKRHLKQINITIAKDQRFIVVDAFLSYVARQNQNEIDDLKQKSDNEYHDYS